jgi:hypothetical protein
LVFELTQGHAVHVRSALSGRTYRFAEIGDRQVVDPRDLRLLQTTAGLRMM